MPIEAEHKPRRLRIVSGTPAELEYQLNQLLDEYIALVWSFNAVGDQVLGTVVMIHASEQRKAALAQAAMMGRPH